MGAAWLRAAVTMGGGNDADGGSNDVDGGNGNAEFTATASLDGTNLSFSCGPEWLAGEGNLRISTSQIVAYSIRCRSSDGTSQVNLGFAAPAVGTTEYSAFAEGISLGGNNEITPLNLSSANVVSNRITLTTGEAGVSLVGTFAAEWDTSNGGVAGAISGAFDLAFE